MCVEKVQYVFDLPTVTKNKRRKTNISEIRHFSALSVYNQPKFGRNNRGRTTFHSPFDYAAEQSADWQHVHTHELAELQINCGITRCNPSLQAEKPKYSI
jgi:hypothetical protein